MAQSRPRLYGGGGSGLFVSSRGGNDRSYAPVSVQGPHRMVVPRMRQPEGAPCPARRGASESLGLQLHHTVHSRLRGHMRDALDIPRQHTHRADIPSTHNPYGALRAPRGSNSLDCGAQPARHISRATGKTRQGESILGKESGLYDDTHTQLVVILLVGQQSLPVAAVELCEQVLV